MLGVRGHCSGVTLLNPLLGETLNLICSQTSALLLLIVPAWKGTVVDFSVKGGWGVGLKDDGGI
jgi:hypothetical protein